MSKFLFILSLGLVVFGTAQPASAGPFDAATENLNKALVKTELPSSLTDTIGTVVKVILSLVGTIFLLLTIYAGVLWMTAQGNEDQVAKSKSIVQTAVIGLIITLSAYAITAFVTGRLGSISDTNSSNIAGGCCQISDESGQSCSNVSTQSECSNASATFFSGSSCVNTQCQ